MKKLLFVNACIRENSRTEELARRFLAGLDAEFETEEVRLSALDLRPFNAEMLRRRDRELAQGGSDAAQYRPARQFAAADRIVIAAPYWDCLFPAVLRIYMEHVCAPGIAFAYGENGSLIKTCHADSMIYLTTCGGFLSEHSALETWIREMGKLFSIEDVRFCAAQGLDVYPDQVPEILNRTLDKITGASHKIR